MHTDIKRLHRVHIKGTRKRQNVFWGNVYPVQWVKKEWAQRAGIPVPVFAYAEDRIKQRMTSIFDSLKGKPRFNK